MTGMWGKLVSEGMRIEDFTRSMSLLEPNSDPESWSADDALRAAQKDAREMGITKCMVLLLNNKDDAVHYYHAGMSDLEVVGLSARHFVRMANGEVGEDDDD